MKTELKNKKKMNELQEIVKKQNIAKFAKILKKHIFTQNSLLDKSGHNHWFDLIDDLGEQAKEEFELGMETQRQMHKVDEEND